jgi:hypothetical protein
MATIPQLKFPEIFTARQKDKLHYRYPGVGGESYMDVIERVRPIIIGRPLASASTPDSETVGRIGKTTETSVGCLSPRCAQVLPSPPPPSPLTHHEGASTATSPGPAWRTSPLWISRCTTSTRFLQAPLAANTVRSSSLKLYIDIAHTEPRCLLSLPPSPLLLLSVGQLRQQFCSDP